MRKIFEVLRLKHEHKLSERTIASSCGVARSTVQEMLKRCRDAQLCWPLPTDLDEVQLYGRLYPQLARPIDAPLPDFALITAELTKKGVTLALLWQEYKAIHPNGLQYSAFCERYALFRQSREVVMRQSYRARETVCRLRRPHHAHHQSKNRRSPSGVHLRGRAGLSQLHLCLRHRRPDHPRFLD